MPPLECFREVSLASQAPLYSFPFLCSDPTIPMVPITSALGVSSKWNATTRDKGAPHHIHGKYQPVSLATQTAESLQIPHQLHLVARGEERKPGTVTV